MNDFIHQISLGNWTLARSVATEELARLRYLNDPNSLAKNDPSLFKLIRCRVLKSFCVKGKPLEIGSLVSLERHLADSLQATGKLEILVS